MRNGRVLLSPQADGALIRDAALVAAVSKARASSVDAGVSPVFARVAEGRMDLLMGEPMPLTVAGLKHFARAVLLLRTQGERFGPAEPAGGQVFGLAVASWVGGRSRDVQATAEASPGTQVLVGFADSSLVSAFVESDGSVDSPLYVGSSAPLMREHHALAALPYKGDRAGLYAAAAADTDPERYSDLGLALAIDALFCPDPAQALTSMLMLHDSDSVVLERAASA